MAAYTQTVWVNNTAPALNATNLNKLTDELESQAVAIGRSHTLPTWADGVAPALTDAAPLNEMERITELVALEMGLTYAPTAWETGWTPARNAARFNKLEQQAAANRAALDGAPADVFNRRGLAVYNYGSNDFTDTSKYPFVSSVVLSPGQDANRLAFQNYWSGVTPRPKLVMYKTLAEASSAYGATSYAAVTAQQTTPTEPRFDKGTSVPAEEIKYHDLNFPGDQWRLYNSSGGELYYGGFPQSWLVDLAKPTYQQRALQYLVEQCSTQGWDGVFFDNIVATTLVTGGFPFYRKNSSGQLVIAYSDVWAWANATEAGVAAVLGGLVDAGYATLPNCNMFVAGDARSDTAELPAQWLTRLAPYSTQMLTEYCSVNGSEARRSVAIASGNYWTGWTQNLYAAATQAGSGHVQGRGGGAANEANVRYAVATFRVTWDGITDSAVGMFTPYWPINLLNINWGDPVGSLMTSGNMRARRWEGAWAVVNPGTTQASATFADPLVGGSRQFTLAATDAYVGA